MINIIAGVTDNFCLGNNGDLVVKNKEDLKLFKELTLGSTIVMGRKTWDSLPKKPLLGRYNIVLTNNPSPSSYECTFVDFDTFRTHYNESLDYWVIGGAEIYKKFLEEDLVDSIYLSKFAETIEGDTYFPKEFLKTFDLELIKYGKTFKQEIWRKRK